MEQHQNVAPKPPVTPDHSDNRQTPSESLPLPEGSRSSLSPIDGDSSGHEEQDPSTPTVRPNESEQLARKTTTPEPSTPISAKPGPSNVCSAGDYLSKDRKTNPAKSKFRHVMKTAAMEARAWGKVTMKGLTPPQRKYIHDRIVAECPALKGHEREVDTALSKSLSEAKYYSGKTKGKSPRKTNLGKKRSDMGKSPKKRSDSHKGKTTKQKKKSDKRKSITVHTPQNQQEHKVSEASQQSCSSSRRFQACDSVIVRHRQTGDCDLATATYVKTVNEMYSTLSFGEYLDDAEDIPDIELHQKVPASKDTGRDEKTNFNQLEEDDIFYWKTKYLESNKPAQGLMYGSLHPKDVFKETTADGKRSVKPNPRYN